MTAPNLAALRETAQSAAEVRPGAWKVWGMDVLADPAGTSNLDTAVPVAATRLLIDGKPRTHLCDFIATFDPPMVLALLDRLDAAEAEAATLHAGWPCADYKPPITCLTTPKPKTLLCDWCRSQPDREAIQALYGAEVATLRGRLAAVEALLPPPPMVDGLGMIHHESSRSMHSGALECSECTGWPHSGCVSAADLRAALGEATP